MSESGKISVKIGNLEVYGVVYKITNKVNGKVYIGQTINKKGFRGRYPISKKKPLIEGVYNHHIHLLKKKPKGCNQHLLNSIRKYGFECFDVIEVFDVAFSKTELDIKEDFWISFYKSINDNFGYNRKTGGANGKPSQKSIEKLKQTQIRNKHTRKINQLSIPDFKVIKTFNSISEATRELGLSESSIKNVLNSKCKANTSGGYAWEYCDCENLKYKKEFCISKNGKMIIKKHGKNTDSAIVLNYFKEGKAIDEISFITGIKKKRVYQIIGKHNMIKMKKQAQINNEAEISRSKVLALYLNGYRKCDIQKTLGLSKSIVEKAIDKYNKNIIDINGKYIK